ncbi:MAG: SIR2 family protein [Marinisporobacter sp.]|jgi:non-canonical purine NTP pyrophosphatase (RdgB/HAM1 family)|nr:SIR2 family protein [Marinisporobacter sp.]
MELRFVSSSKEKYKEIKKFFENSDIDVIFTNTRIDELQTEDVEKLLSDKVIKAYKKVRKPLFVEHTCLCIEALGGYPGLATGSFWEKIQSSKLISLLKNEENRKAVVRSIIYYFDGKKIKRIQEELQGEIADNPKGKNGFAWDDIFIPKHSEKTFAQLDNQEINKKKIMRIQALSKLKEYVKKQQDENCSVKEIKKLIDEKKLILFVGAGVSMNAGLPSWDYLIKELAEELDFESEIFMEMGNSLELAEYYELMKGSLNNLVKKKNKEWHSEDKGIEDSKIHKLITKLKVPIIYTTNYDRWLEKAFEKYNGENSYTRIMNIANLSEIDNDKTQIIKLHGDFEEQNSIVLTESSYFERLDFHTPLDIKLKSDILGKSILFIGYSLKDINIRYLLYKIESIWKSSSYHYDKPQSYIFTTEYNPIQEKILESRNVKTVYSDIDNAKEGLENFLNQITDGEMDSINKGIKE